MKTSEDFKEIVISFFAPSVRSKYPLLCVLENNSLVKELQKIQIPLEVSPHSNYCLAVVKTTEPHPIRKMIDAGFYCTLNSDDPSMFSTNLNNEDLTLAAQEFKFDELWQLNINTLNAAFLPVTEKDTLRQQWNKFL